MNKITVFFQYFIISLLLIGAAVFLIQQEYLQAAVYSALGALFLGYSYSENKKENKQKQTWKKVAYHGWPFSFFGFHPIIKSEIQKFYFKLYKICYNVKSRLVFILITKGDKHGKLWQIFAYLWRTD